MVSVEKNDLSISLLNDAGYFAGATVVAFACSGNILSGVLVTKFNMTVPQMIKFSAVATACSLCCVFVFMIYCPTPGKGIYLLRVGQ